MAHHNQPRHSPPRETVLLDRIIIMLEVPDGAFSEREMMSMLRAMDRAGLKERVRIAAQRALTEFPTLQPVTAFAED